MDFSEPRDVFPPYQAAIIMRKTSSRVSRICRSLHDFGAVNPPSKWQCNEPVKTLDIFASVLDRFATMVAAYQPTIRQDVLDAIEQIGSRARSIFRQLRDTLPGDRHDTAVTFILRWRNWITRPASIEREIRTLKFSIKLLLEKVVIQHINDRQVFDLWRRSNANASEDMKLFLAETWAQVRVTQRQSQQILV